jgi:hypothetical protein
VPGAARRRQGTGSLNTGTVALAVVLESTLDAAVAIYGRVQRARRSPSGSGGRRGRVPARPLALHPRRCWSPIGVVARALAWGSTVVSAECRVDTARVPVDAFILHRVSGQALADGKSGAARTFRELVPDFGQWPWAPAAGGGAAALVSVRAFELAGASYGQGFHFGTLHGTDRAGPPLSRARSQTRQM